ncbi:hypothetical protein G9A89_005706 [Geosiphon pyriformis]|nr:hypothetical protein G9A89_005706 [Geosiphon pyriformis]
MLLVFFLIALDLIICFSKEYTYDKLLNFQHIKSYQKKIYNIDQINKSKRNEKNFLAISVTLDTDIPPPTRFTDQKVLSLLRSSAIKAAQISKNWNLTRQISSNVFVSIEQVQSSNQVTDPKSKPTLYFSFKGPHLTISDWRMFDRFVRYTDGPIQGSLICIGILETFEAGKKKFEDLLLPLNLNNIKLTDSNSAHYVFTGFSIGGAMAVLFALFFAQKYSIRPKVITFGQPRIGDIGFALFIKEHVDVYRVTHGNDELTLFPNYPNYRHHELEYWIPNQNQCECDNLPINDDSEYEFPVVFKCLTRNFIEHPNCNSNTNREYDKFNNSEEWLSWMEDIHRGPYFGIMMG